MRRFLRAWFTLLASALLGAALSAGCAAGGSNGGAGGSGSGIGGGFAASGSGGACANCSCTPGQTQSCYGGPNGTEGVGVCTAGVQRCDETGTWSACQGAVLPSKEVCDGKDDDCNGQVDDGLGSVTCGLGVCQKTVPGCRDGQPVPCIPGTPDPKEICDGLDHLCDGHPGEGCDCENGQTQKCYSGSKATENVGTCKDGAQTCVDGKWAACMGDVTPVPEKCNGLDDDCDGVIDNGDPGGGKSCDSGQKGVCAAGTTHCQKGQIACVPNLKPMNEICDGLDEDCDGVADNGDPGGGQPCTTGLLGVCSAGTTHCQNGKIACVQNVQASPEVCDGKDNDCDGIVDNGDPGGGQACSTGKLGVCAAGTTHCQNGKIACVQNVQASPEVCDGLDNDCDGVVDNGNPGGGGSCSTGLLGVCSAGTYNCINGKLQCTQNVQATPEAPDHCTDGLDNNCNGLTDAADPNCACAHALCTAGAKLFSGCSSDGKATNTCVQNICAADPFCCNPMDSWDALCVQKVRTICGSLTCAESEGTCPNTLCTANAMSVPYASGCDSNQANCTSQVCALDSFCCTFDWDLTCVGEVNSICSDNCTWQ